MDLINEWETFRVNVWVRRSDEISGDLTDVSLNLDYNNQWFQLASLAPSSGVGSLNVQNTGEVLEITASQFAATDAAIDEFLLLGSFRFRPVTGGALANDVEDNYPTTVADLQFSLTNIELTTTEFVNHPGQQVGAPATQLQAVPYDVDDEGVVGLIDLTYLIRNIGKNADRGGQIQFPHYYQPPAPLETESLVAMSTSNLLEAEEIPPSEPLSPPLSDEEANRDAAFGTLDSLVDCWESSMDDNAVQENFEQAISFAHTQWRPNYVPDWVLQESAVADCLVEHVVELLDELEEEFPRLERFFDRLKSRFEDR
ncbi:hypothetical protein [Blastopirellula marina]|uniref:Uncharacterized protein n=1 Tax=Blastopirellula marina DSM 3645 TaxID=314230 RepID=A3ZRV2_9BACT|nr:hypothetical protein [Blastopirellula marina]EAQ80871.1 hypothetical protein DSM3645_12661 [Blastopirellula marina DSM 3645]